MKFIFSENGAAMFYEPDDAANFFTYPQRMPTSFDVSNVFICSHSRKKIKRFYNLNAPRKLRVSDTFSQGYISPLLI